MIKKPKRKLEIKTVRRSYSKYDVYEHVVGHYKRFTRGYPKMYIHKIDPHDDLVNQLIEEGLVKEHEVVLGSSPEEWNNISEKSRIIYTYMPTGVYNVYEDDIYNFFYVKTFLSKYLKNPYLWDDEDYDLRDYRYWLEYNQEALCQLEQFFAQFPAEYEPPFHIFKI